MPVESVNATGEGPRERGNFKAPPRKFQAKSGLSRGVSKGCKRGREGTLASFVDSIYLTENDLKIIRN